MKVMKFWEALPNKGHFWALYVLVMCSHIIDPLNHLLLNDNLFIFHCILLSPNDPYFNDLSLNDHISEHAILTLCASGTQNVQPKPHFVWIFPFHKGKLKQYYKICS